MISEYGLKTIVINHYPTFVPNEYLFKEYAKKLKDGEKLEKWEVYAAAVNDLIKTKGNMGVNDMPFKLFKLYREFLVGKSDEIEVNGKTYYYPHDPERTKKKN